MQWSRAKKQFESLLAPSLQKRLRVHVTEYSKSKSSKSNHDASGQTMGRGWITLDGNEVASVPIPSSKDSRFQFPVDTLSFGQAVRSYLNLTLAEAAASEDALVRGLAFLDRRLGKRRLKQVEVASLDAFSHLMYRLRCDVEGIVLPPDVPCDTAEVESERSK